MSSEATNWQVADLAQEKADVPHFVESDVQSPEDARWYHFIFVTWLTPFIKKAAKTPLQFEDLFTLHPDFHSKNATQRIMDGISRYIDESKLPIENDDGGEVGKDGKPKLTAKENQMKWAIMKGIVYAERRRIFISSSLHAVHMASEIVAPIFLSGLLNSPYHSSQAYWNVLGLFLCQLSQALAWNNSQYASQGASISVKAALIAMIYKKAFRLGTKGRMKYPTGVIMNLIASDCDLIAEMIQYLSDVFVVPLEILALSILIIVFAGPAGAAGLAFLVVCMAGAMWISTFAIKYERNALAFTDERVKVIGEVINGIKIVKFFGWESSFIERLKKIRDNELKQHLSLRMISASFSAIMNVLPPFVNVITFSVYRGLGNTVDAATVFSTLSIINLIKLPIAIAPIWAQMIYTLLVSTERLGKFLSMEEMEDEPLMIEYSSNTIADENLSNENAIVLKNTTFQWAGVLNPAAEEKDVGDGESIELGVLDLNAAFKLKNIDLTIKRGSLTVVVGKVGSGKSSFLQALIGDMIQLDGKASINGKIGYSPQSAWLQNTTLRSNILFGAGFDETRYNQVIQCCSLAKDLLLFSHGDMSEIGEKGVTLSGGQAARVNLARAVYSDADIILLDDPLAAVDSHVGRHILEECILGYCRDKTVILVTHQLHIAHHADHIIVLDNGVISEQGTYDELMAGGAGFNSLMQEHGRKPTDDENDESDAVDKNSKALVVGDVLREDDKKGDDLMEDEERITGGVSLKYYLFYFRSTGSLAYIAFLLGVLVLWQAVSVFGNFWFTFWVSYEYGPSDSFYMVGLAVIAVVQSLLIVFTTIAFARACIHAGRNLHNSALDSVLRVPMLFFETNPSGRIISRFSKDFSQTDRMLPHLFQDTTEMILNILGILCMIVYASPYMLIVIALIIPVYLYILKLYRSCKRETKRVESLSRSPLYSHISETFAGISTIRAFGTTNTFIQQEEALQDLANRPTYIINCIDVWVSTRAETFVAVLIGMMALLGVVLAIDKALLGLALSYCLTMMLSLNFGMRNIADVEARMNSVERLYHYISDLMPEGKPDAITLPAEKVWPSEGAIKFKNLSIKYRPELEPVLHDLTVDIPAGSKVGVVGRTGAGKSTIISAIFRLVEFHEGTIEVDGVDISSLDLTELRSHLAIIPQAPILFDGTIRSNLDPFGNHTDEELWTVLDRCSLKDFVSALGTKLDAPVAEGGSNLSLGQRQLLCLGRAMLVKSKILLIDEATASVDLETDMYIQKVLREEFSDCTILCIAHRLNTLMDYDKILVLESGKLMEVR
ncbi:P-loop containing nucleoside triphosphate hydrolase protein [Rhizoclosmatium globosum]|uniref:p-loop containing nucleoside triphosphate hydrolase protein n=1 Tax=Rhizoclosmatium globosum TaxID=329046 RepID=A0A1Y2CAQ4_9FUNG|nr:P-loop containing nucleoside triphosphate hydrolase protein [Rhizoclosmatium globosum]|eukprot:ORY43967.1 P-loop containing nucleoside triphosphate hydrolase protein [Rhizoclosmatium globosum]